LDTNLYGLGDSNHPTNSHELPALIRRFHEAAERGDARVTCWGTGTPMREFLHVDDLGEACVFALENWLSGTEEQQFLNVGTGVDLTIRELAEAVAAATGFQGEIHWDASKPDGTPKKQLNVTRLAELGWRARIPLAAGLRSTVAQFREDLNQHLARV
jgi:GDP-L-fucose synthase